MKVAKTNQEEISRLNSLLNEIECMSKDFRSGNDFSDLEWAGYEIFEELPKDDAEKFLKVLCHKIAGIHFQIILFNCSTLLDNCADENQDTLDFNPTIKAGFEAIKLLKEIYDYLASNPKNHIYSESILHEKIKSLLSKFPVDPETSQNEA
jgi:hypothetical protein